MTDAHNVLLVDASPYIFRAFFSLPNSLVDRRGRPSNAVHGFGSFLLKLTADERPTHLAVVFDGSLTTSFRNDIYPDYKRQREPPSPDLEAQLDDCRELAAAFGAATFVDRRYEADDILGTLCSLLMGEPLTVVTSDKDLAQLVSESVTWLDFAKARRYGPEDVRSRFGVAPERIPDLLGLAGDPVDNIPGVRGIGAKSAVALLEHFGSLAAVSERVGEIDTLPVRGAARLRHLFVEQEETARMSECLATVARDVPMEVSLDDIRLEAPRLERLDALFERLGSEALHRRLAARE